MPLRWNPTLVEVVKQVEIEHSLGYPHGVFSDFCDLQIDRLHVFLSVLVTSYLVS
jgi:hypothetical protein